MKYYILRVGFLLMLCTSSSYAMYTLRDAVAAPFITLAPVCIYLSTAKADTPFQRSLGDAFAQAAFTFRNVGANINNSKGYAALLADQVNLMNPWHVAIILCGCYFVVWPGIKKGYHYIYPPQQKVFESTGAPVPDTQVIIHRYEHHHHHHHHHHHYFGIRPDINGYAFVGAENISHVNELG
ncbi:MAG: hypothetical protein WC707_04320 [Candidatus Babeliaceae bacterium]|jgi:hypothetical protein